MILRIGLLFFLGIINLQAQEEDFDYNHEKHSLHIVEFTDKNDSPYSVFRPQEFLSARALYRREKTGVQIDEYDIPINTTYINKVLGMGVNLHGTSKWLNAIAIHTMNQDILDKIVLLPFVKRVKALGKFRKITPPEVPKPKPKRDRKQHTDNYYGEGFNQVRMLAGDALHQLGYTGKGVHVAIFDGGFEHVNRMPVFDSLFAEERILGTWDFVQGDPHVYEASTHGTDVLSCMGSKAPHLLVGTAPDAYYYLFTTEDVQGEFQIEEFNWVAALEHADSLGVEVVNSSLGYTHFNDTTMSYEYDDMNGQTAYISRGAEIGVSRGILVVNSAGNEGRSDWHYVGAPADAPGVLSIAAVRGDGRRANFSSWGPTPDGRIKPDIAAQGFGTVVSNNYKYAVKRTAGTSFSSPVMAGMVASLKQAFPESPIESIKQAIKRSSTQFNQPDSSLGYGIPNYFVAYILLNEATVVLDHTGNMFSTFGTVGNRLSFIIEQKKNTPVEVYLIDKLGQIKYQTKTEIIGNSIQEFKIPNLENYPADFYILKLVVDGMPIPIKIIKE